MEGEHLLVKQQNAKSHAPQRSTNTDMPWRTLSHRQKDHRRLEDHGDSISCITGFREENTAACDLHPYSGRPCSSTSTSALRSQGLKITGQAPVAGGETEDICSKSWRPADFTKNPTDKVSSPNSANSKLPYNASKSLYCNPSLKDESLHLHSDIENSSGNTLSKDTEENSSFQLQLGPHKRSMDPVESSLGGKLTSTVMDKQKSNRKSHARINTRHENSKANTKKGHESSIALKNTYQCSATRTAGDGNLIYYTNKHVILNQQGRNHCSSLHTSNFLEHQLEPRPTSESSYADPDTSEDDLKVCDICGDLGREDLLAICSRCGDGAEHTYCMRVMVHKVPKGNWLCEECQLKKKTVTSKVEKSEMILGTSRTPYSGGKVQKVGSRFNFKLLPKVDISARNAGVSLAARGHNTPQIFAKIFADYAENTSSSKKHSEICSSATAVKPSRKPVLASEISFKNLDSGKLKPVDYAPCSEREFSNISKVITRPLSPAPNSLGSREPHQLPRGLLSRSGSFNRVTPKVKQIVESVPQKPQVTKESAKYEIKMESSVRTFNKSASFKNISSRHLCATKLVGKTQSEESRNLKQGKESFTKDRKNSFLLGRILSSSSLASSTSASVSKRDSKTSQNDEKLNLSEPNTPSQEGAHGQEGQNEWKKQASHVPKTFADLPSNESCSLYDQNRPWDAPRESTVDTATLPQQISMHSFNHDEKIKDSSPFGSPQSVGSSSSRVLCCQRCNEEVGGYPKQFCPVDELQVSVSRPSAEHHIRTPANKGNKQKNAADAAISKSRVEKTFPVQLEEISSTHLTSEAVPKNQSTISSSHIKDLTNAEGTGDNQNSLRNTTADTNTRTGNDVKQYIQQPMGTWTCQDGESDVFSPYSEELKVDPPIQIIPEFGYVLFDPSRVPSLPKHEYLWLGSFDVKRAGRLPEPFSGIQAHLSTCASPKVLEVASKFPDKIQLEEVPRLSTWPQQFQENSPAEENIALFFFAKDVMSYEKSYMILLENMINKDLALTGNFNGIELIIFPSSQLPEKSQRWNWLFFLWGVFRERRSNCSEPLSGSQSKASTLNINMKHMAQDLHTQLVSKIVASEMKSSNVDMDKGVSRHDKSTIMASDFSKISSLQSEGRRCSMDGSFGQKYSTERTIETKLLVGTNTSHPVPATGSLSKTEKSSSDDPSPLLKIGDRTMLCLEVKSSSSNCQVRESKVQ